MILKPLLDAGFTQRRDLADVAQAESNRLGLSAGGPHVIVAVLERGPVTLTIEQNSRDESNGGRILYPPVCIVEGPNGRVACQANDEFQLALTVAEDVA